MFYIMYPYKHIDYWFCSFSSPEPIKLCRHMCWGIAYKKNGIPHSYTFSGKSIIYIEGDQQLTMFPKFKQYSNFTDWFKGIWK